ncbi:unnamed protein product, partial [Staurois parvus]
MLLTLVVSGKNAPYIGGQWGEYSLHWWSGGWGECSLHWWSARGAKAPYIDDQRKECSLHWWLMEAC